MLIKSLTRRFGIDVMRFRPASARVMKQIRSARVDTVVDVGASKGQFAKELRAGGFGGDIISFEPVAAAFEELAAAASNDARWTVVRRAVGETPGELAINVASNHASSSFLLMRQEHRTAAPTVRTESQETVPVVTLDSVDVGGSRLLLKVDVQGYEDRVIAGGPQTLGRAVLVLAEVSLAPLYEGQPTARTMIDLLGMHGFELVDLDPFFYDPKDGRVLSVDALFMRR